MPRLRHRYTTACITGNQALDAEASAQIWQRPFLYASRSTDTSADCVQLRAGTSIKGNPGKPSRSPFWGQVDEQMLFPKCHCQLLLGMLQGGCTGSWGVAGAHSSPPPLENQAAAGMVLALPPTQIIPGHRHSWAFERWWDHSQQIGRHLVVLSSSTEMDCLCLTVSASGNTAACI